MLNEIIDAIMTNPVLREHDEIKEILFDLYNSVKKVDP